VYASSGQKLPPPFRRLVAFPLITSPSLSGGGPAVVFRKSHSFFPFTVQLCFLSDLSSRVDRLTATCCEHGVSVFPDLISIRYSVLGRLMRSRSKTSASPSPASVGISPFGCGLFIRVFEDKQVLFSGQLSVEFDLILLFRTDNRCSPRFPPCGAHFFSHCTRYVLRMRRFLLTAYESCCCLFVHPFVFCLGRRVFP